MINFVMKRLPVKAKGFVVQYIFAAQICNDWGERATPGAVKFVWSEAALNWETLEQDPQWTWGRLT